MEFHLNNVKFTGFVLLLAVFESVLNLEITRIQFWLIMLGVLLISWERKQ